MQSEEATEDRVPSDPRLPDHRDLSWDALRQLSLSPGGFGRRRVDLWPTLLHAGPPVSNSGDSSVDDISKPYGPNDTLTSEPTVHPDERQIQLDTERSFVLYPVEDAESGRQLLQSKLHELLVSIFRKRPALSYFQGYHDIITVLFLTLPPEVQFCCAEKLSLHRVRDSMDASLEPVLGLLRILRNLLRVVDPPYASLLERNSPLPFYALSNLLTLFSHDMPTLALIQHVFDYLLCRPPIFIVYLAAAVILSRKEEVQQLEKEGEEGMMHSLLSGLPDLYDAVSPAKEGTPESFSDDGKETTQTETASILELETRRADPEAKHEECVLDEKLVTPKVEEETFPAEMKQGSPTSDILPIDGALRSLPEDDAEAPRNVLIPEDKDHPAPPEPKAANPRDPPSCDLLTSTESKLKQEEYDEKVPPSPSLSRSRAPVPLVTLLAHADDLYNMYPPTHTALAVPSIMGPQSVVFTWSEDVTKLPYDDAAEAIVTRPELIVHPFIEEDEDEDEEPESRKEESKRRRKRRKLRKPRRFSNVERRTMVAGAVLVLGVAMAVYGVRARGGPRSGADGHMSGREWRRVGRWIGGALVGASERIVDGFREL